MEAISLPQSIYAVTIKNAIIVNDGNIFGEGLSNQHAIEGIAMTKGKKSSANTEVERVVARLSTFRLGRF